MLVVFRTRCVSLYIRVYVSLTRHAICASTTIVFLFILPSLFLSTTLTIIHTHTHTHTHTHQVISACSDNREALSTSGTWYVCMYIYICMYVCRYVYTVVTSQHTNTHKHTHKYTWCLIWLWAIKLNKVHFIHHRCLRFLAITPCSTHVNLKQHFSSCSHP
jgi:hypothetical protein